MAVSAPELARLLADALGEAEIPYAIGGALALGVWGFPRATNDVDMTVFVSPGDLKPVLSTLRRAGCLFDHDQALRSAAERGDFKVWKDGMRVDVFVSSIPFYDSAAERVRQARLEGRPASFLSPEDLIVFKLLFLRTKDILDVERLVAFVGDELDRKYVRKWLVEIVGEDDERVGRWDRLVEEVDSL